jgi:hypothetical protein
MTAPLRSRYRVVAVAEVRPGDILRSGGVRVRQTTVTAEGRVHLTLADGTTSSLAARTTVGIYR